jgi:glycosyltransferase involved in cell wall biosynthesis
MSFLFIPFKNKENIGGPSTFMANLKEYLILKSFKFHSNPKKFKESSGIFFPISYDKYLLSYFKNNILPIIQRLDGIYYPSKHGKNFEELNKDIKDIYSNFSTHIIFQSQYCKIQCFEMFGELSDNRYSIIYNGADKKIFYPGKKLNNKKNNTIKLITTGNFRNIDMLEPVIIALDILSPNHKFEFTIIGPISNRKISKFVKRPYVKYIKKLNLKKVADYLRTSDIFIYSHLNPPCPNSVIEAISCGIPVVSFDSGSMSELLFFSKDLLAPVSDKIFQEYREFNPILLKNKIEYALKNLDPLKKRAMEYSDLYSFENTGASYIKLFNQLLLQSKNS